MKTLNVIFILVVLGSNVVSPVQIENGIKDSESIPESKNDKFLNNDLSDLEYLPLLLRQLDTGNATTTQSQTQVTGTRQGPCHCAAGVCGCCSGILLNTLNQKACVNVTYDPDEFSFTANVLINDRVLYTRTISGKNPRPICVPIPRIPVIRACVRFSNVYFQGRNVHACVGMEGKFRDTTLFKVGLDCIRLGANGVAVVKPEDGGGLGSIQYFPEDEDDNDEDYDDDGDDDDDDDDNDDDDDDDDLLDY